MQAEVPFGLQLQKPRQALEIAVFHVSQISAATDDVA